MGDGRDHGVVVLDRAGAVRAASCPGLPKALAPGVPSGRLVDRDSPRSAYRGGIGVCGTARPLVDRRLGAAVQRAGLGSMVVARAPRVTRCRIWESHGLVSVSLRQLAAAHGRAVRCRVQHWQRRVGRQSGTRAPSVPNRGQRAGDVVPDRAKNRNRVGTHRVQCAVSVLAVPSAMARPTRSCAGHSREPGRPSWAKTGLPTALARSIRRVCRPCGKSLWEVRRSRPQAGPHQPQSSGTRPGSVEKGGLKWPRKLLAR